MSSSSLSREKTVGFILDYIHGYQETVWHEVSRNLRGSKTSLVAFIGQSLGKGSDGGETATNNVFKLAFCDWIESFLISGATLGSYLSKDEYAEFLRTYRSKKCVSIGACGENIPAVVIENREGILKLIDHLVRVHGKKRIAYLSGPAASAEADVRLAAYREGLSAAGLPYDPNLVHVGNFWYSGGKDGIDVFLDQRRVEFDAVVAANDYMALGAMRELVKRGMRVPQDISVTGYDDVIEAECESPALTTVRQPIPSQAAAAVRYLLDGSAAKLEPLKTQPVFRRSCGCQTLDIELASRSSYARIVSHDEIAAGIAEVSEFSSTESRSIQALIASCLAGAERCAFENFFQEAEAAIYRGVEGGDETAAWQNAISVIRRAVWPRVKDSDCLYAFETTIGKLRILIGMLDSNKLNMEISKTSVFNESLALTLKTVGRAEDLEALGKSIRDNLGAIGLKSFYLAVREGAAPECGPKFSVDETLVLYAAIVDGKDLLDGSGPRRYPAKDFLPRDLLPSRVFDFVAMPLAFGLNFYGVAVYEPGPQDGSVYPRINDQITGAVQSALVVSNWKAAEQAIAAKSSRIVSLAKPISESVLAAGEMASREAATIESVGEAARKTKADIAQTENAISRMAQKARSIKEYIAIIEDISSTISLLGLNAAIEAARAGQAGRGFNVIAGEIRKLSESTRINVESIGATLGELSNEAEGSVVLAKRSSEAFTALDSELENVLGALKDISGRLDGLSLSSQELIKTI